LKKTFEARKFEGNFTCHNFSLLKLDKKWEILEEFNF
jgi:hypothetical protein